MKKRNKVIKFFHKIEDYLVEKINSKPLTKSRERAFKSRIRFFFSDEFDESSSFSLALRRLGITDLKFREYKEYYHITITLIRPGYLIGKGGSTIEKLKLSLSNMYNKKVEIHIIESKLWY
jgi:ribosomal protein S3